VAGAGAGDTGGCEVEGGLAVGDRGGLDTGALFPVGDNGGLAIISTDKKKRKKKVRLKSCLCFLKMEIRGKIK
jgi:hypothetical protein